MADKRITELSLHTSLTLSDIIPIVNNNETKKTTYGSLYYAIREGLVSGSSQLTASYDERYALSGSGGGTIPAGTVSGSAQITSFGFVSGSFETTGRGIISSSAQISGFETTGRGILSGSISYTNLTNIPSSLVSGSSQLTSSYDLRYVLSGSTQSLPSNLVSSSAQITSFGFVSGSFETTGRGILSGSISYTNLTNIPTDLVSGSSQLTSSFDGRYESQGRGIISSSQQLPAGLVSGSSQIDITQTTNFTQFSSSLSASIAAGTNEQNISNFALISGGNEFIGNQTITGSFLVSGSTTQIGNNTLIGRTELSGSIAISGSTEFGGDLFPKEARGATIGTLERPFRDIFLQSASINIASDIPGGRNASISNADGNVTIQAAGFQLKTGSFVPFEISETARVQIKVPNIPAGDIGAFSIIGNASGSYQPITSAGGMVHITGNDGQVNRFNLDAFGSGSTTSFNGVISRAARGTSSAPSQSKAGDVTLRISSIGWRGDTGFGGTSVPGGTATSLDFIVLEDQLDGARGSAQQFYNAPIGTRNRVLSAQIDTSGLFVSGTFTSSLSQGHIWVGDGNNRTKLFSTSSFATTGSNVFSGSQGISGSLYVSESLYVTNEIYLNGNKLFNYAQFSDTTTQSGSANTAYSMKFNTTDISHNISMVSGSRITVQNTGIYNLQFSAQLDNDSNTNEVVDIWIAVTGSNIPNSTTTVAINKAQAGNLGKLVAAWNYMIPLSASQYVELKWNTHGGNIILLATGSASNPTRPATPSVIATITQVA